MVCCDMDTAVELTTLRSLYGGRHGGDLKCSTEVDSAKKKVHQTKVLTTGVHNLEVYTIKLCSLWKR